MLGDTGLYREAGYVGLSRARHRSELHLNDAPDDLAHTEDDCTVPLSRLSTSRRCRPSPTRWSGPRRSAPPTTSPDSPHHARPAAPVGMSRVRAPDASSGAARPALRSAADRLGCAGSRGVGRSAQSHRAERGPLRRLDPTDPTATPVTCHPRSPNRPRQLARHPTPSQVTTPAPRRAPQPHPTETSEAAHTCIDGMAFRGGLGSSRLRATGAGCRGGLTRTLADACGLS